jgi:hypothetical protein
MIIKTNKGGRVLRLLRVLVRATGAAVCFSLFLPTGTGVVDKGSISDRPSCGHGRRIFYELSARACFFSMLESSAVSYASNVPAVQHIPVYTLPPHKLG